MNTQTFLNILKNNLNKELLFEIIKNMLKGGLRLKVIGG